MSAIIFDFDGTLVDTEPLHEEAVRAALQPHDVPVEEDLTIGLADEDAITLAFQHAGRSIDHATVTQLCLRKTEIYESLLEDADVFVYPGAVELVRATAEIAPVAICTAAVIREVRPVLNRIGLEEIVRLVVTADEVENKKPHPDAYHLAAQRLDTTTDRCLAIEDSVRGVESAKSAGCFVLAIQHTTPRDRLTRADLIVDNIGSLTAGDLVEMAASRNP